METTEIPQELRDNVIFQALQADGFGLEDQALLSTLMQGVGEIGRPELTFLLGCALQRTVSLEDYDAGRRLARMAQTVFDATNEGAHDAVETLARIIVEHFHEHGGDDA